MAGTNDPIERLYERALDALEQEDAAKAKQLLKQLQAAAPDDLRTVEIAGDTAALDEDFEVAATHYARLLEPDSPVEMQARGAMSMGLMHVAQEDRETAIGHFQTAVKLFDASEDADSTFRCMGLIAECFGESGNVKQAVVEFKKAIDFAIEQELTEENDILLDAYRQLAECQRLLGDLADAWATYDALIEAAEAQGDDDMVATAFDGVGVILMMQGRFEEAREYLLKSLAIHEELEEPEGLSLSHGNLARLHVHLEDWDNAEKHIAIAKRIDEEEDNVEGIRFGELLLAEIAIGRGNYAEAEKQLKQLVRWYAKHGVYDDVLCAQSQLGFALRLQGKLDDAEALQQEVLENAREMGDLDGIASTLDELAEIRMAQGDEAGAAAYWKDAAENFAQLGSEQNVAAIRQRLKELGHA